MNIKNILSSLLLVAVLQLVGCSGHRVDETIETSNILMPEADMKYNFKRTGLSSVDYYEVDLLEQSLDLLRRNIRNGIQSEGVFKDFMQVYQQGFSYMKPEQQVGTSAHSNASQLRADLQQVIDQAHQTDNVPAAVGNTGYVGGLSGKSDKLYVDKRGVVSAELFDRMLIGMIYLDKIINQHLDESILNSDSLRYKHEALAIVPGTNYTALEHHWDLAYGYYKQITWLAQADGSIPSIQQSSRLLQNAFVIGRYELGFYNYDRVMKQVQFIRDELARVFMLRTLDLLQGQITVVNYNESPQQAFKYLSQACGMIYSLQFLRSSNGTHLFTYDDSTELLGKFLRNNGLWNSQKLIGESHIVGSIQYVVAEITSKLEQ